MELGTPVFCITFQTLGPLFEKSSYFYHLDPQLELWHQQVLKLKYFTRIKLATNTWTLELGMPKSSTEQFAKFQKGKILFIMCDFSFEDKVHVQD